MLGLNIDFTNQMRALYTALVFHRGDIYTLHVYACRIVGAGRGTGWGGGGERERCKVGRGFRIVKKMKLGKEPNGNMYIEDMPSFF